MSLPPDSEDDLETVALRKLDGKVRQEPLEPSSVTRTDGTRERLGVEATALASDPGSVTRSPRPSETSLSLGDLPGGQLTARLPQAARTYGRFDLLLELAAGGMAMLYLARLRGPEDFEKLVALKIIHPHLTRDAKFIAMFKDEARLAALLHHPNAVQIYDLGQIEGSYFIAMEFVRGQDLRAVLHAVRRRQGTSGDWPPHYGWSLAARIVADAAAGLHAAHELTSATGEPLGLVHRDVSPHNLLVSYEGHVKLTDFGIAKAAQRSTNTDSGTVKGKLAYMSPEQAMGEAVDRRSDVFSLGVVLWEAVTLKRLFKRKTDSATLHQLTSAEIPSPRTVRPNLPEELEAIVMRSLARDAADRFDTALELQQALEGLIAKTGRTAGSTEIKTLMQDCFAEQRAVFEADIRAAVEGTANAPPTLQRVEGTQETRLSAQVQRAPQLATRSSWLVKVGAVAAVAIIGALAGVLLLREPARRDEAPSRPASPRQARLAPRDAAPVRRVTPPPRPGRRPPQTLLVKIRVLPPEAEATITFRGQAYRQNRVELILTPSQHTERLRVEAPGYEPGERFIAVRPGATLQHVIQLKPRPRPRHWRPRPRRRDPGVGPVDIGLED